MGWGALWGAFLVILESSVGKVLAYLGVAYFTYSGVDILLDSLKALSFTSMSGSIPPQLGGLLGLMRMGEVFNVLFSAYVARLTLQGYLGGITHLKFVKP
ncbi:MAG: DUF2523 domain-containing protein [Methylotenera sp.]|nr:DUF2523 domain-containing protein [Methylotenera sp.]